MVASASQQTAAERDRDDPPSLKLTEQVKAASDAAAASTVVAMAASAGGLQALMVVLSALPGDFPAASIIVQHVAPDHPSMLAELLARRSALEVQQAHSGDVLRDGFAYVAPPNRHVIIAEDRTLALTAAEPVQWVRPSADVMFDSVARAFGPRAAGVVLSGTGRDGAAGCVSIHEHGGRVIVQDEETSEFYGMPQAALLTGDADIVLPLPRIAAELVRWAKMMKAAG